MRRREKVLAEVIQLMQEMGVRASAEELTDLLLQAAPGDRQGPWLLSKSQDLDAARPISQSCDTRGTSGDAAGALASAEVRHEAE